MIRSAAKLKLESNNRVSGSEYSDECRFKQKKKKTHTFGFLRRVRTNEELLFLSTIK